MPSSDPLQSDAAPLFRQGAWAKLAEAIFPLVAGTGVVLLFVYRPGPAAGWASIADLRTTTLFGLARDLHFWGAALLVIAAWLHLFRVFVVGAYRRIPGWALSVGATLLVVGAAATGWALRLDHASAAALHSLGLLDDGGVLVVYALHVFVLPLGLLAAVLLWKRRR